ncbi:MAG: hypothetical protein II956_11040 [Bacteroidales bacterium]|nr:hypothetical protein [Bacteroidales bacterium]
MNKHTKFAAALLLAATTSFVYVSCDDDNDNKNEEKKVTAEASDFQKKLGGTFVELFKENGFMTEKYVSYWKECCAKYVGEENADATFQMLKTSMTGTLYGPEAQAKYGDGTNGFPNGYQFNCGFIGGVYKFVIDGKKITGLDSDSKTVFSHEYTQTGEKDGNFYLKSDDGNDDEFKYFMFRGDTPAETYHLEFRYGKDSAALMDMFTGAYAYWLAAAMLENETETNVKACIKLFCDENLADYKPAEKKYVYATTDMTWSEFYAADLDKTTKTLQDLGIDAVSSATNVKGAKFANAIFEADGETASKLPGVKSVNIAIEENLYNSLEDKSRFTLLDAAPSDYKEYNADGSFGKWNSKVVNQTVTATLTSGFDAKWGNYVIALDGLEGVTTDNLQGAILTTTDGAKYGLQFLNNLWLKPAEFTFCIEEFTEPHGCKRAYKQTADLEGKTLSNITYILKDGDNISADLNLYVKKQTSATVSAESVDAGTDVTISLNFSNIPNDANYILSAVKKGSGKRATALSTDDFTFLNGKLTIKGDVASGDVFSASFVSEKYVNIGTTITIAGTLE